MFSEQTISVINSIKKFGENRKGVIRVSFPDGTFQDLAANDIPEMSFTDFAKIALKLDGTKIVKVKTKGEK